MKKFAAVLLAALMLLAAMPLCASAAQSGYVHDEVLDDGNYYHMEYVEQEGFFANSINLMTALGLYDDAWYNYFDKSVDINYAKAILLSLVEKVEEKYENQVYEEIIGALEGASDIMGVITKVGDFTEKFSDALKFTQSAEWSKSIEILNAAIKIANYGNEVYEAYIRGYAAILSAKAASVYYGNFLTTLVDNCENEAVRAAALDIRNTIDAEMADAVNELIKELVANAGKDAADLAANIAMDSYGVTAAIKSGYNTVASLSNKIFNTKDKYEFMMSLVEVYYIEDCFGAWAKESFASDDDDAAAFAESVVITIRATGEQLLENLANATTSALIALVKNYDTTEMRVKSAVALAKLEAARAIFEAGADAAFKTDFTATGRSSVIIQRAADSATVLSISNEALDLTVNDAGVFISVYSKPLDQYIKVGYFYGNGDYDFRLCGAVSGNTAYVTVPGYYLTVGVCPGRIITVENVCSATGAPAFNVIDNGTAIGEDVMSREFSTSVHPLTTYKNTTGGIILPGKDDNKPSGNTMTLKELIDKFFADLVQRFKDLFKIFDE